MTNYSVRDRKVSSNRNDRTMVATKIKTRIFLGDIRNYIIFHRTTDRYFSVGILFKIKICFAVLIKLIGTLKAN